MLDPQLEQKKTILSDFMHLPTVNSLLSYCQISEETLLALDIDILMAVLKRSIDVIYLCQNNQPFSFSELCQLKLNTFNAMLDDANDIVRALRGAGTVSLRDFMKLSLERRTLLLRNAHRVDYLVTYCKVTFKELTDLDLDFLALLIQESDSAATLKNNTAMTVSDLAQFERDRVRVFLGYATAIRNLVSVNNIPLNDLVLVHPARLVELHNNPEALRQIIVETKEAVARLGRNAELTGNDLKRDISYFGWVPREVRMQALVYSRDHALITPRDAKEIVSESMYKSL